MAKEAEAAKAAGAAGATAETAKPAKQTKDPKPEGFVSPVEFAKLYSAQIGREVRPQMIYGYIKNNKGFGGDPNIVQVNTDGHQMVNTKAGLAFLADRDAKASAAKQAKAAAAAAAPATPAAPAAG